MTGGGTPPDLRMHEEGGGERGRSVQVVERTGKENLMFVRRPGTAGYAAIFNSSEEIVGRLRLGQLAKRMIEGEFEDAVGAKAIGFCHGALALLFRPSTTPLESSF